MKTRFNLFKARHALAACLSVLSVKLLVVSCIVASTGALRAAKDDWRISITLSWIDRSRIEEAYHVERRVSIETDFSRINDEPLPANTSSFTDPNVMEGVEYVYRVVAANEYGESSSGPLVVQVQKGEARPLNSREAKSTPRLTESVVGEIDWGRTAPFSSDSDFVPVDEDNRTLLSSGFPELTFAAKQEKIGKALVFLEGFVGEKNSPEVVSVTPYLVYSNYIQIDPEDAEFLSKIDSKIEQYNEQAVEGRDILEAARNEGPEAGVTLQRRKPNRSFAKDAAIVASDTLLVRPKLSSAFFYVGHDRSLAIYGSSKTGPIVLKSPAITVGLDGRITGSGSLEGLLVGRFGIDSLDGGGSLRQISPYSGRSYAADDSVSKYVGVYESVLARTTDGVVRVLVGPDGSAEVYFEDADVVYRVSTGVSTNGKVQVEIPDHIAFDLKLRRRTGNAQVFSVESKGVTPGSGWVSGRVTASHAAYEVLADGESSESPSRLVNISIRSDLKQATDSVILGFVVGGDGASSVLIRGIGPGLSKFGVSDALDDPEIFLSGRVLGGMPEPVDIANNDNWSDGSAPDWDLFHEWTGAFPLRLGSRDAAMLIDLNVGTYTAIVQSTTQEPGNVLAELYELPSADAASIGNMSSRLSLPNDSTAILGFRLVGDSARRVLVRAVGPGLSQFGLLDALQDPRLRVLDEDVSGYKSEIASNDDWEDSEGSQIGAAILDAGAFPLESGSRDSAYLGWLAPGTYHVQVNSAGDGANAGIVLIELFLVD